MDRAEGDQLAPAQLYELRAAAHADRSAALIEQTARDADRLEAQRSTLPKSELGKALKYLANQWATLTPWGRAEHRADRLESRCARQRGLDGDPGPPDAYVARADGRITAGPDGKRSHLTVSHPSGNHQVVDRTLATSLKGDTDDGELIPEAGERIAEE